MIASLAVIVLTYRRLTDVNEGRRVRIVMIGLVVGAIAGTPVLRRLGLAYLDEQSGSAVAGLAIYDVRHVPFPLAAALVRLRHLATSALRRQRDDRQGLRYVLARRALLTLVPAILILLGADRPAHGGEPLGEVLRSRLWLYVALVAIAVVAQTEQHKWLNALDRRFFRERYNAQRLLRQVAEDVRRAASLDPVAPTVVSRIEQALHPVFVALLVRGPDGRRYRTIAASPPDAAPRDLDAENKVLALTRLVGKPLEITSSETQWLARKMPIEDIRTLHGAAIDLLVPITSTAGDAPAFFALGPKRSEEPYRTMTESC